MDKNDKKKKIQIEIRRQDGKTFFKFTIDPNIVKMYEGKSSETRESVNWPGLKFYWMPDLTTNQSYRDALSRHNLIDDYGAPIFSRGYFNIAWLRTVGGTGEIKIEDEIMFSELSRHIKQALSFMKEYFEEYYREFTIKGNLVLEI